MARSGGTPPAHEGGTDDLPARPEDGDPALEEGRSRPVARRSGAGGPGSTGHGSASREPRTAPLPRPVGYGSRLVRRVGGALVSVGLVVWLSWWTVFTVVGQALDSVLMEAVTSWSTVVAPVEPVVTGLVSVPAMVLVALVVAGVAALRRRVTLAGRAVGVVVGANLTTQLVKSVLDRPDLGVTFPLTNSLPSGHTTFAASVALALVIVAPAWFRSPAAWLGWVWTSLMGVVVMVSAWHRPADVLTAVLVSVAWALALAPVEHRVRHGARVQRVMAVAALVLLGLGVLGCAIGVIGVDLAGAGASGHAITLGGTPWRERLLSASAVCVVSGVIGLVMHEVDRLSWG